MVAAAPVSIFIIVALVCFLLLSARAFWKFSRLSTHSRFDLYPVPKEGGDKAKYGGSYFEQPEWWTKERHTSLGSETVDIMKEMLFIRKLFINQRSLWWGSFLFHGGIYVMFAWSILLIPAAFWQPPVFLAIVNVVGVIGFACATFGAVFLLIRRIVDESSRVFTTPVDYFNLILILLVLVTGIVSWTTVASPVQIAHDVLTFDVAQLPTLVAVHFVLLGAMLIYIPLSKMGHYAGKYFCFHRVLWDNDPNTPGSKVEQKVRESAANPPTTHWDAPHTKPESTSGQEG